MNLWQEYWTPVRVLLGLGAEPQTLTFVQISLRGIIVFMFTLLMVRISARRSLARRTVFDSVRSEEHTSELQSRLHLVCRLLLEKKKQNINSTATTTAVSSPHHVQP